MRDFTAKERRELLIPDGWKEPEIVERLIPLTHGGILNPQRPGDRRPETRAFVFHGTGNIHPSAGATANAKYFCRPFERGQYYDANGKRQTGLIEAGSMGRGVGKLGIPFRVGSAHCICGRRLVEVTIPFEERAQNCGDRPLPWTEKHRGMQPLATELLAGRDGKPAPNSYTWSIEIVMADEIKNSSVDWEECCMTARWYAVQVALEKGMDLTELPLLRHYDVTGKQCPSPFVGPPNEEEAWLKFKAATIALYKFMRGEREDGSGKHRGKGEHAPSQEAPA